MGDELKPCPFCGKAQPARIWDSREAIGEEFFDESNALSYQVVCDASKPDGPGGCGGAGSFKPTHREAIEAWNARSTPTT